MLAVFATLLAFIIALGILVTVHEFGHFWVAKKCGVKVLRFAVGFGKPLFCYTAASGTQFVLGSVPLGGYVKMLDEREGEVADHELKQAFNRQSLSKRVAVVIAGPLANILFAIFCFWLIYSVGIQGVAPIVGHVQTGSIAEQAGLASYDEILTVAEQPTPTWHEVVLRLMSYIGEAQAVSITVKKAITGEQQKSSLPLQTVMVSREHDLFSALGVSSLLDYLPVRVVRVVPQQAAALADMRVGDEIVAINDEAIKSWSQFVEKVQKSIGITLHIEVIRAGVKHSLQVIPSASSNTDQPVGVIGIELDRTLPAEWFRIQRYQPWQALYQAIQQTWLLTKMSFSMIEKMLLGYADLDNLGGPITIAKGAGQSAQGGLEYYMAFLALISVSLAVINLLPIPMLDGGHLFYYFVEWLTGKPVSEDIQQKSMALGMCLLIAIMSIALYNDMTGL